MAQCNMAAAWKRRGCGLKPQAAVRPLQYAERVPILLSADLAGRTTIMIRHRWLIALAAIATALVLVAADADARAGRGFSGGSRGMRTFSAPAADPHRAEHRRADPALDDAARRRFDRRPGGSPARPARRRAVRRRLVRRTGRRLHRRRPVRHAVRPRHVRRHGRLCLDPRPAAADRAGRDRRPAAVCLVAAAQRAAAAYAAAHPATGQQSFGGLGAMLRRQSRRPASRSPSTRPTTTRSSACSSDVQAAYSAEDLRRVARAR